MSDDEEVAINTGTGNALLQGELLRNKSSQQLIDVAIYSDVSM